MDMQMMIWAAILAVVAVVMIARTFGKAFRKGKGDGCEQ